MPLTAGDAVSLIAVVSNSTKTVDLAAGSGSTYFSGHLFA